MKKLFLLLFVFSSLTVLNAAPSYYPPKQVNLFLVGSGNVGKTLMKQIETNYEALKQQGIDLRVVGIANTKGMCFYLNGFPLDSWAESFNQYQEPMSLSSFIARFTAMHLPHSIFIDCTSNQEITDFYPVILQCGISIVTPNKKANSGMLHDYNLLQDLATQHDVQFLYDANVGAGLPILSALKDLKNSGDRITKFEATLSGTLSYIFYAFQNGKRFSEAVLEAQTKGYTEPDPRDDLLGLDFVRKVLILARTAGIPLEMHDIGIQRLLPENCFQAATVAEFYEVLKGYDETWEYLKNEANSQGKRLRYLVTYENGEATVQLKAIGPDHPFFNLTKADNAVAITSDYYPENSLVIQGPGAGLTVTASKVLANIVQIAKTN